MKKCKDLSIELLAQYNERAQGKRFPQIVSACSEHGTGEGFELSYAGGVLSVKAQSPLAEAYALGLLRVVVPAGHWHEFLGLSFPRFPLRALWLQETPQGDQSIHWTCRRTVELGFNALAWRGAGRNDILRQYGLKFISLDDNAPDNDFFIYQGSVSSGDEDHTMAELTLRDLQAAEGRLSKTTKLIYIVPYHLEMSAQQYGHLMLMLYRECGPTTILAFSAVAGSPTEDHCGPNPYWEALRCSPKLLGAGLLPIFNTGCVKQGEGHWPGVCFDQMELLMNGCRRHAFAGSVNLTHSLPALSGFLEANLWVMGQLMWKESAALTLLDTWLRANKNVSMDAMTTTLMQAVREVMLLLSRLRGDEGNTISAEEKKYLVELLALRIRGIEMRTAELEKKRTSRVPYATICDYLVFFLRDAKRLLKMSNPAINIDDDGHDSTWTTASSEGGNRKPASLERANPGQMNSRLALLYFENKR